MRHCEERSDVAISCRQSQFRRWLSRNPAGYCEIATSACGLLAMTRQGSTAVHQRPRAVKWPCTRRSVTAATDAIGAYRFYRQPIRIVSIAPWAGNPKNSGGDSAGVYGNLIIRQRRAIDREHSARDFSSRRDSGSAGILCVFQAFRTDGSAENIRRRPRMRLRGVAAIRTGRKSCRSRPRRCARQRGPSAGRAWS